MAKCDICGTEFQPIPGQIVMLCSDKCYYKECGAMAETHYAKQDGATNILWSRDYSTATISYEGAYNIIANYEAADGILCTCTFCGKDFVGDPQPCCKLVPCDAPRCKGFIDAGQQVCLHCHLIGSPSEREVQDAELEASLFWQNIACIDVPPAATWYFSEEQKVSPSYYEAAFLGRDYGWEDANWYAPTKIYPHFNVWADSYESYLEGIAIMAEEVRQFNYGRAGGCWCGDGPCLCDIEEFHAGEFS